MALNALTATIPAGNAVSTAVNCSGSVRIVRIIMPSAWTSAPLTFCLSPDNTTFHDLYHTPTGSLVPYEVTIPAVTPDSIVSLPPDTGYQVAWLKLRSGMHATPVNQAADRVFQIIVQVLDDTTGEGGVGTQGPTGPQGGVGPTGATGPTGLQGPSGTQGIQGIQGLPGGQGTQGIPGPTGLQGPTGIQGPSGSQGAQGGQGNLGPAGPTGPTGTFNLTGTVLGDNAGPGIIGEVVSLGNSAGVALTTAVTANVVTLALTAGDWTVSGLAIFTPSAGPTSLAAAIATTSATLPTAAQLTSGVGALTQYRATFTSAQIQNMPAGTCRVSISAPTSVYLVAQGAFTGTLNAAGYISARRIR